MSIPKSLAALAAALCLLAACGAPGQAPSPSPEPESPASVSEPAPEPETSSPEPLPEPETSAPEPEKEPVPPPEPDGNPLPPQGEVNPDTAPDFGDESYADVVRHRADPLWEALELALKSIGEDYSSFDVTVEDGSLDVVLEIGVINEEGVDRFLADWSGPAWDRVEKKPGRCSVAKKEAFVLALEQLELEPGVWARGTAYLEEENILVGVRKDKAGVGITKEEEERLAGLPQAVKDLAGEMGIPEELLEYMPPRHRPPLENNPD